MDDAKQQRIVSYLALGTRLSPMRVALAINETVGEMMVVQEDMPGNGLCTRHAARAAMQISLLAGLLESIVDLETPPAPRQLDPVMLIMVDLQSAVCQLLYFAERRNDFSAAQLLPELLTRLQTICLRFGTRLGRQIEIILTEVEPAGKRASEKTADTS